MSTYTEPQFLIALENLVIIEMERAVTGDDFLAVAGGNADLASAVAEEYEAANDAADWWDNVGKAEWKGEA